MAALTDIDFDALYEELKIEYTTGFNGVPLDFGWWMSQYGCIEVDDKCYYDIYFYVTVIKNLCLCGDEDAESAVSILISLGLIDMKKDSDDALYAIVF